MKWAKFDYRLTLSYYNAWRRIYEWFKPAVIITEPKSIIIGATVLLGDLLMQAPLIQALRSRYPQAKITLLVPKGWAEFAKLLIGVDDALEAELNNGKWLRRFRREHRNQWDLGAVPFVYPVIPLFYGLGVCNILSFPDPKGRRAYQIHQCIKPPAKVAHMSRMLLNLVNEPDAAYPVPHLRLPPSVALDSALQGRRYVVIHPGASLPTRHWPGERYVAVAKQLLAEGYELLFTGNQAERVLADAIIKDLPADAAIHNRAGKTDLLSLAVTLQGAAAVVGPDTGVLHMAKALAVPVVALLGPGQQELFAVDPGLHDVSHTRVLAVLNLACRDNHRVFKYAIPGVAHCRRARCLYDDLPCMTHIEVSAVVEALREINIL